MRFFTPAIPRRSVALVAGSVLVVAACSGGGSGIAYGGASSAPSEPAASTSAAPAGSAGAGQSSVVAIATDAKLGAYLTGQGDRALYVFTKDSGGSSACSDGCATTWPPFTVGSGETITPGAGITGTFGTIVRADGSTQVTYDGAPLYYFAGDKKAGDTTGEGLNGVWFVATPSGAVGAAPTGPASATATASNSDGYTRGGGVTSTAAPIATPRPTAAPTTTPRPTAAPTTTPRPTGTPKPTASPKPTTGAASASVTIVDFAFTPASLTVTAGSTVTWTNTGSAPHTVTADGGGFASGTLASGATFTRTFTTPGTYAYHCAIHSSMTGTIVVTG